MVTPTQEYRRTDYRVPSRPFKGLDARVNTLLGVYHRRPSRLAQLRQQAEQIEIQAEQWRALPNAVLHDKLMEFREQFRRAPSRTPLPVLPALAAIREAADRQKGYGCDS